VWGSFLWHQVFSFDGVAEFGDRVLVGDSIRRDIVPAKALGMLVVHAVYGDRNFHEEERDGADFVISGIGDVIGVIGREE
jgi:putative hydrolase of the HAD superfamily